MRRTLVLEFDDASSETLRRQLDRNLKQIFNNIRDQIGWGDTERTVCDNHGNPVGRWRLICEE